MKINPILSALLLFTACCNALDVPWMEGPVYYEQPLSTKGTNRLRAATSPQWLFFVSAEMVNATEEPAAIQWDLISHMTITPEQCEIVTDVVEMLDDALHNANPGVPNMTSIALRVGNTNCTDEGNCPCENSQQRTRHRALFTRLLLEVRTRSPVPELKPPLQFPLRVASFETTKSARF
jgi:hypothetical protein